MAKRFEPKWRKNTPDGIQCRGLVYASVPEWGECSVWVLEESDSEILVQRVTSLYYRNERTTEKIRCKVINVGRPTMRRIEQLKQAITGTHA